MRFRLARRFLCSLGLLVCIFALASPTFAAPARLGQAAQSNGRTNPATHLYEAQGGSVVGYPLNADGLPATTPDWRLNGGLRDAYAIAFDCAGNLYVSDFALDQVRVYAQGASADELPLRTIPLPGPGARWQSIKPATSLSPSLSVLDAVRRSTSMLRSWGRSRKRGFRSRSTLSRMRSMPSLTT